MDAILQQKRKGQAQFRIQIDQYLSDSLFTKQQDQLTPDVIHQIFSSSLTQNLYQNGKISIDKLMQSIYATGCHFSTKEFQKIFNNKKELRPQDIYQVLKSHDLAQFDLEEQIAKHFFQEQKFSVKKLDKVMKELGYNQLNRKDKEIMIECFDYDRDNAVTGKDLEAMMDRVVQIREDKKKKKQQQKGSPGVGSKKKLGGEENQGQGSQKKVQ